MRTGYQIAAWIRCARSEAFRIDGFTVICGPNLLVRAAETVMEPVPTAAAAAMQLVNAP